MIAKTSKKIGETKIKPVETKMENKKEEKQELKNIYLVDYCIKDLTLNKIIETNLPEKAKASSGEKRVLFKGKKPILEGMKSLFPKVEETIKNLKENEEKTLALSAIDAYGFRNKELLRVVSLQAFKQNKINPFVGLVFETEGLYGIIKSISGGRVMVDFNSPYADHEVEVYVKKVKTCNEKEKIETLLDNFFEKAKAKLKNYQNDIITIELTPSENINAEMYKQLFEGFFKNFIKYKEIVVEEKKQIL
ncbi:MAG: hypothetical protein COT14_01045 [Candidatus Diapherotrites archaeon CG08_land_8_20_14_0_20_30_16]|nr:MAG: hypothetical protein COT14_01045 [Candidatus Diapherotrites archaeon CG08_land_8_20_14_0_20_30_16]